MKIAVVGISFGLLALGFLSSPAEARRARCADFASQAEAQAFMQKNSATYLDRDSDGVACESLPRNRTSVKPPASSPVSTNQTSIKTPPNQNQNSATGQAVVVNTGDGDTLRVQSGSEAHTIRLGCVDAPERSQTPWGTNSATRLKQILPKGQVVQVRRLDTDRYGRTVAELMANGRSVNLQMVQEGQAVVCRQYLSRCDANQYVNAEAISKQQGLGVWNRSNPLRVMPWDYRRTAR